MAAHELVVWLGLWWLGFRRFRFGSWWLPRLISHVRLLTSKRYVPAHSLLCGVSCLPAHRSLTQPTAVTDPSDQPCGSDPEPLPKHLAATAGNACRDCLGFLHGNERMSAGVSGSAAYAIGGHCVTESLQLELIERIGLDLIIDRGKGPLADEDLAGAGCCAESRG